jgi:DNA-binding MarR family transcriptional regulator
MKNRSHPVALADVEARRSQNLRQLLLRASRVVNRDVVEGLQARGYSDLRATHTTLLSHLDLAGSSVTLVAERAGITKQAMGRLATELEEAGYLAVGSDSRDGRIRRLELTQAGQRLMLDSFEVMAELEQRYGSLLGQRRLGQALRTLAAFIEKQEGH